MEEGHDPLTLLGLHISRVFIVRIRSRVVLIGLEGFLLGVCLSNRVRRVCKKARGIGCGTECCFLSQGNCSLGDKCCYSHETEQETEPSDTPGS